MITGNIFIHSGSPKKGWGCLWRETDWPGGGIPSNKHQIRAAGSSLSNNLVNKLWWFILLKALLVSKQSNRSDQVIKDDFHRSRFLIPIANASTGDVYVTAP